MKRTIVIAFVLMLGSVPAAAGYHLSAGGEDRVPLADDGDSGLPVATNDAEPTVPDNGPDSAYQRGIATSAECTSTTGNIDDAQSEAQATVESDPFCGQLRYHEGLDLEQVSPVDQHFPGLAGDNPLKGGDAMFDVVRAYYAGPAFGFSCFVFCKGDPQGDAAWDVAHTVGSQAGLTNETSEASERENSARSQSYGAALYYPSAVRVAQWNTQAWQMNGWISPSSLNMFIAFVQDSNGQVVDDDRLEAIAGDNGALSDRLHPATKPTVCGMTPDYEFQSTAARASCEAGFTWHDGDQPGDDGQDFDGYEEECDSPTYVCNGAAGDGAWYSDFICLNCDYGAQEDYLTWHFFVAPHGSECGGTQQPGMSFSNDGADAPYLAHDVDVWTPPTDVTGADGPTRGVHATPEYSTQVRQDAEGETPVDEEGELPAYGLINEFNDNPVSTLPIPAGEDPEAERQSVPGIVPGTSTVKKEATVEPNAEPVNGLADNSQSFQVTRTGGSDCAEIVSDENPNLIDPWVNQIDSRAMAGSSNRPVSDSLFWNDLNGIDGVGLHDNEDPTTEGEENPGQDSSNNPGPGMFFTRGNVGLFTDVNDNGKYEDINFGSKYDASSILAEGAYPMLWENWVTDDGEIDTNKGCELPGEKPITEVMEKAGYGAETALFQAIYLKEPTVFEWSSQETSPGIAYTSGNNVYLLFSQSADKLWEGPGEVDPGAPDNNAVDDAIDRAVDSLRSYADANNGEALDEPDLVEPGDDFNSTQLPGPASVTIENDFDSQCGEDTGGFESQFSFLHNCETDCSADTIVTGYTFEVTTSNGVLGGNNKVLDPLTVDGEPISFGDGPGTHTWFDVDPFDGDASRNTDAGFTPPAE